MAIGDIQTSVAFDRQVGRFPPRAEVVTPSNSEEFTSGVSVFSNDGGDISVVPLLPYGSAAIVVTVAAGGFVPFMVRKVNATGTTSTSIVAVW
uniref:Spike Base Protein n=1 Tax=Ribes TaxID=3801 RepID=UPI0023BB1B96|nr:Chain h, Spike Base Protein [Ribes]